MPVFSSSDPTRSYKKCIRAARFRVKWKDIFDVKEFYRAMRYWFMEQEWADMEEGAEHYETLYYERIGLFGDKEMWWRWRPQKIINNYFRYHIDLDYHLLYLVPTEIVRDGKKLKKNIFKGEVEIWITAMIETDWQDQWRTHPLLKYFNSLFRERIFRRTIYDQHKRELYREAYVLQNFIKRWFKLKRYLPYEEVELFHSPKSYPSHSGAEQST